MSDTAPIQTRQFPPPRAAYIHVPFCRRRCGYCTFTLLANRDDLIDRYLLALERELSLLGARQEIDTLFFGGGTPSHLPAEQLERLFEIVWKQFQLADGYECSLEANPADINAARMAVLRQYGVNRLSLGVQSFNAEKLRFLERDHTAGEIYQAFELARESIENVSLDLIFATPQDTPAAWRADLQQALSLSPAHISVYGLTIERGSTFWSRREKGVFASPEEDAERRLFEQAIDTLTQAGFEHYEVSNFAQPGARCRHNETYWRGGSYFAAGPGAARYVAGRRETNHRSTTTYLQRVLAGESPVAESERLAPPDLARERLVFALRMMEGVDITAFQNQTGFSIEEIAGRAVAQFVEWGLLSRTAGQLRLTREGLMVSDSMWERILAV